MNTTPVEGRPTLIRLPKAHVLEPPVSRLAAASLSLGLFTGFTRVLQICLSLINHAIFEMGILLTFITAPLALLLGMGALWEIRRSGGAIGGRVFAVIGICITLFVMALYVLPLFATTPYR